MPRFKSGLKKKAAIKTLRKREEEERRREGKIGSLDCFFKLLLQAKALQSRHHQRNWIRSSSTTTHLSAINLSERIPNPSC